MQPSPIRSPLSYADHFRTYLRPHWLARLPSALADLSMLGFDKEGYRLTLVPRCGLAAQGPLQEPL